MRLDAVVKPQDFRLISGGDSLSDYQFGAKQGYHRFCKTCGIAAFGEGYVEQIGGAFVSINVACLADVTPEELAKVRCGIWMAGTTTGSTRRR